jgi:hypothetical protein
VQVEVAGLLGVRNSSFSEGQEDFRHILRHRIIPSYETEAEKITPDEIIN